MFKIEAEEGKARAGKLKGINTPFFMPVATKGAIKHLQITDLKKTGTQVIISNAYLLYKRPGLEIISSHGGLKKFMKWNGLSFTDSGGFQLVAPGFLKKIDDSGILFHDFFDHKDEKFTPKLSMQIQDELKSDVAMALDDVPRADSSKKRVLESVNRTTLWAKECIKNKPSQLLFGIGQGGTFLDLRKKSAEEISKLPFDGFAIGGLAIGENKKQMHEAVKIQCDIFPKNKPRYFMGLGTPEDIIVAVSNGVDVFDSIFPTQIARRGTLFAWDERINIKNNRFKKEMNGIKNCDCFTCKNYTLSYLHHLFRQHEGLYYQLATIHNISWIQTFMKKIREEIIKGNFENFKKEFLENYTATKGKSKSKFL